MREDAFSLIELMASLLLFGVVASAMTGGMLQMQKRSWQNEVRSGAIAAAQQVLDELRLSDPISMPSTGSSSQTVTVGGRSFVVTTSYCAIASYCTSAATRQIRVGVSNNGKNCYQVDTIYSQLR